MKILLLCAVLVSVSIAKAPFWVFSPPSGYENRYYSGTATAVSSSESDQAAYLNAVKRVEEANNGVRVIKAYSRILDSTVYQDGVQTENRLETIDDISTEGVSGKTLLVTVAEMYREQDYYTGQWKSYVLVRVPRTENIGHAPNGFTLGLRSAIIPGWGQVKKYEKGKGIFYFVATAGLISASIVQHNLAYDAHDRALQATSRDKIDGLNEETNLRMTISISSLIGAGLVWAGNIVSAVHKPEKVYE